MQARPRLVTVPQAGQYPPCSAVGCPRKSRKRSAGGYCRKHGGSGGITTTCATFRCGFPRVEGSDWCERHGIREIATVIRDRTVQSPCAVTGCTTARFKAGLCGRHATQYAHEIGSCLFGSCGKPTWRSDYCGFHDIGVDFAAGDWFDEVAVDQMYHGRHDRERKPTVLEVLALVERADRNELQYVELAGRLGVTGDRFERWRYHAKRMMPLLASREAA